MTSNVKDYNLWQFFKETQFSVEPSQDILYRYSFAYFLLNQISNLDYLTFKTSYDGNKPYFFLETTIPQDNKVVMHQGLEYFLKLFPTLKLKSYIDLENKQLVGRIIGTPGEIAVIDFNPNEKLSTIYVDGYYGQLDQAPRDLILLYFKGLDANSIGAKLD